MTEFKNQNRMIRTEGYVRILSVCAFFSYMLIGGTPVWAQSWPESIANRQVEFELNKEEIKATPEAETQDASRGQVQENGPIEEPTVPRVLERDVINPFDTEQVEAAPAMQMMPEDITVPELPDPEIQQQINMDEFRNYLDTLVKNPPVETKTEITKQQVKRELGKISISSLMTSPEAYVVINDKRFKIGDRFSLRVKTPSTKTNMENFIEQQMPEKEALPNEVYQKFEAIKNEALEKYRSLEAKRQSEANANTHNISVIIRDIKHRQLVVSVSGHEYIIPIKVSI